MPIPLYGMFETSIRNSKAYENPFVDVELTSVFTSPSGLRVDFIGFFDGDGEGGQEGDVWKQRFMPDEAGTWAYQLSFSDGFAGASGSFECVEDGAMPGFWELDPQNPHWFKTVRGERFMPVSMHASCAMTPIDWQDAIEWCVVNEYNTLIVKTFNHYTWGDGWPNVTCFETSDLAKKEVDFDRMNLKMWHEWDQMIECAAEHGIYIGPFDGPCGYYGGQERNKYPPTELAFSPAMRDRFDTPRNLRVVRYMVARQGAYWNIAYWSLGSTEVYYYAVEDEAEFLEYGAYFASITPWGRMITGQDAEQWHQEDRRWLSKLNIPDARKLNTVQTSVENPTRPLWGDASNEGGWIDQPQWQEAGLNNELALDSYSGCPIITTEGLWEGQGRAERPLRIIWGFACAASHVMWADWRYENEEDHTYSSIGRGWTPLKPLDRHLFQPDQLGADCVGQEQLKIALKALEELEYWKMNPANELVKGSDEAYCLAEPGRAYVVYAPNGGTVCLNTLGVDGKLALQWLDPRNGERGDVTEVDVSVPVRVDAPGDEDWVLVAKA